MKQAALTPREREVLRLLAQGYDNHAIAAALYITEGTVKLHVKHIYEKLDVHSRHEAVARAWQHGWVEHNTMGNHINHTH